MSTMPPPPRTPSDTVPLPLERIREIHAAHKEGRALIPCRAPGCKHESDEPCIVCGGLGYVAEPANDEPPPPEAA